MKHGNGALDTPLHTLIPLADFKAILGIDDRENVLSQYCLITSTYTVEQYCKRRLVRWKHTDYLTFAGEHIFTLREYPVRRVLAVNTAIAGAALCGEARFGPENLVEPKHYHCLPDEGIREDLDLWPAPFSLALRPPYRITQEKMGIRVRYAAGYAPGKAPADLASACLELAAGLKTFTLNGNFLSPTPCRIIHLHAQCFACIIGRGTWPATGGLPREAGS
jgi:hypothetical protein